MMVEGDGGGHLDVFVAGAAKDLFADAGMGLDGFASLPWPPSPQV
jgi:hypothetical protein